MMNRIFLIVVSCIFLVGCSGSGGNNLSGVWLSSNGGSIALHDDGSAEIDWNTFDPKIPVNSKQFNTTYFIEGAQLIFILPSSLAHFSFSLSADQAKIVAIAFDNSKEFSRKIVKDSTPNRPGE